MLHNASPLFFHDDWARLVYFFKIPLTYIHKALVLQPVGGSPLFFFGRVMASHTTKSLVPHAKDPRFHCVWLNATAFVSKAGFLHIWLIWWTQMFACLSCHKLSFYDWHSMWTPEEPQILQRKRNNNSISKLGKNKYFSFLLCIYSHYSPLLRHQANK